MAVYQPGKAEFLRERAGLLLRMLLMMRFLRRSGGDDEEAVEDASGELK